MTSGAISGQSDGQAARRTRPPATHKVPRRVTMETTPYDIEVTRFLQAPRDQVYQAFTDPDQFAAWYGPVGDARVGGRQRFAMVSEADASMRTVFDGRF